MFYVKWHLLFSNYICNKMVDFTRYLIFLIKSIIIFMLNLPRRKNNLSNLFFWNTQTIPRVLKSGFKISIYRSFVIEWRIFRYFHGDIWANGLLIKSSQRLFRHKKYFFWENSRVKSETLKIRASGTGWRVLRRGNDTKYGGNSSEIHKNSQLSDYVLHYTSINRNINTLPWWMSLRRYSNKTN